MFVILREGININICFYYYRGVRGRRLQYPSFSIAMGSFADYVQPSICHAIYMGLFMAVLLTICLLVKLVIERMEMSSYERNVTVKIIRCEKNKC